MREISLADPDHIRSVTQKRYVVTGILLFIEVQYRKSCLKEVL